MKKRCLCPEGDLGVVVFAGAGAAELGNLASAMRIEPRHAREGFELDVGCRVDGMHLGDERRRKSLDVGKQRVRIVEGKVAELEIERTVARHDIERRAAMNHACMHRRIGNVIGGIEAAAIAKAARNLAEKGHDLACDLNRIHPSRSQRRMGFVAAHAATETALALVRYDKSHAGRLADNTAGGPDAAS